MPKKLTGVGSKHARTSGLRSDAVSAVSVIDESLENSLATTWDAKLVEYDAERFAFDKWILGRIRAMGYRLESLVEIHNVISETEVYKVTKQLCADTNLPDFRRMLNQFVAKWWW